MAVYCGMSHKNVTKVMWYVLVQKSSLNNTMFMVSLLRLKSYGGQAGVSVQVSGFDDWGIQELRDLGIRMTEYLQFPNS